MNAVDGFHWKLTREGLKDAVVDPLDERIAAVAGCIGRHNANDARPFRRNGTPEDLAEAWEGPPWVSGNGTK